MLESSTLLPAIKSEVKNNISLSIPIIFSQIIFASSGFVSTAMIAHLGKDPLAASVLVGMIWFSLSVLFFGILNAVSVLVAHQYGAKNEKGISEIMGQAYILGLIICFVIVLVLMNAHLFLHLSTQPHAVLKLAYKYMHALVWTLPGLILLIVGEQFLAGLGHTRAVLRISMMVVPIEIFLIYVLIFGKFGMPALGIAGAGYGLAVTYSLTAIGLILYLGFAKKYHRYHVFGDIKKFRWDIQKELLRIGLPMGFMHVIEVSTFAVATFWIARFGTTILAAHQLVMQFLGFSITIVFAMSQAVTTRVGHEVGRQNLMGVKYAIYVGMILNLFCMLFIACCLVFFPEYILKIDMDVHAPQNLMLVHHAATLLAIAAVLMIFDNFRIIAFGALRGLKDTRFPMYLSIFTFWFIGLSSAYLLGFHFNLQEKGIWWGLTLGIAVGAIILFLRIQYLLRRVDVTRIAKIN